MTFLLFATPVIGTIVIVGGVLLSRRFMPLRYEAAEAAPEGAAQQDAAVQIASKAEVKSTYAAKPLLQVKLKGRGLRKSVIVEVPVPREEARR